MTPTGKLIFTGSLVLIGAWTVLSITAWTEWLRDGQKGIRKR